MKSLLAVFKQGNRESCFDEIEVEHSPASEVCSLSRFLQGRDEQRSP
jgi:hypothetical protein